MHRRLFCVVGFVDLDEFFLAKFINFLFCFVFIFRKYKLLTHTNKNKNKLLRHGQTRINKQGNIYQPRPAQGTSDIARGVGLLIQEKK